MKFLRIKLLSIVLLILGQTLVSCSKTDYAVEPQISFKSIEVLPGLSENDRDTLLVTISFIDGDGNLGSSQSDIQDDPTDNHRAVELEYYERQENELEFKKVITNSQDLSDYSSSYILPKLNAKKGKAIIKGEIQIKKAIWYKIRGNYKEVMCKVRVSDRANNQSNQVETDIVTVKQD